MIIHQREISYRENFSEFFEALLKAKAHMEKKYPEVSVELMYNLAGQRGRATIQTRYASLADYERIDAEVDKATGVYHRRCRGHACRSVLSRN